jgi:hypothetical protein
MENLEEDPFFGSFNREFIYILNGTEDAKLPNHSYKDWCGDCAHPACTPKQEKIIRRNWHRYPEFEYRLNNYGFRSDDFNSIDATDNVLYGGCSNTFGLGLPVELTWAYALNQKFGKDKFFSVAVNSASTSVVVNNTIHYIRTIGKPKAIILLMPDLKRVIAKITQRVDKTNGTYMMINNTGKQLFNRDEKDKSFFGYVLESNYKINFYHNIRTLEFICEELNIPLMWSTWNEDLNELMKNELSGKLNHYVNLVDYLSEDLYQKNLEASDSPFWVQSREGHYPGLTYKIFADVLHKHWVEKYPNVKI